MIRNTLIHTVHIRHHLALVLSSRLASRRTRANLRRTVGRIPKTVLLAPVPHSGYHFVKRIRHADLVPHHQRVHVVRARSGAVFKVQQVGIFNVDKEWWNWASGARVDRNISAISERFRLSAPDRLGAIRAQTPLVPSVVTPLEDALGAREVRRKLHSISRKKIISYCLTVLYFE